MFDFNDEKKNVQKGCGNFECNSQEEYTELDDYGRFQCDMFLTRMIFPNKLDYLKGLSSENLVVMLDWLEKYRFTQNFDAGYIRRIVEAESLIVEELRFRENQRVKKEITEAGKKGEQAVRYCLQHLPREDYKLIPVEEGNPLILESEGLQVRHEYDSIVVSRSGNVFVVESKYFSGTLTKTPKGNWARKKGGSVVPEKKNPMIQLEYQCRALQDILKDFDVKVCPILCVSNILGHISVSDSKYPVVLLENLLDCIESVESGETKLSDMDFENILATLEQHRIYDFE